jgi:hypothetical protein
MHGGNQLLEEGTSAERKATVELLIADIRITAW